MRNSISTITLPSLNGGLNTSEPPYLIADNQSPDMLNVWYKNNTLSKRPGQAVALTFNANVHRISNVFNGCRVVHAGTKLYKWNEAGTKNYKGAFDPKTGYPPPPVWLAVAVGDYFTATAAGQVGGESYSAGDKAVYADQIITATVIVTADEGKITAADNISVVVTAANIEGSPLSFDIPVVKDDTSPTIAAKIRSALSADTALTFRYTVGGEGASITLKKTVPDVYDNTFNISITRGTCPELEEKPAADVTIICHNALKEIPVSDVGLNIQDKPGLFVELGDMLYYIDGVQIWRITSDFIASAVVPYNPVVMINCRPDLSASMDNEAFNLIGAGFTVKYNGDGTSKTYKLPLTKLDSATVRVVVNGNDVTADVEPNTEGNATVTFDPAPPAGTNNVWITAYKTQYEKTPAGQDDTSRPLRNRILKCTLGMAYGGESSGLFGGTRVFLSGNPEYPLRYWRSDLGGQGAGMAYFPDTSEEPLDQNPEPITAMAKMANQLVIFKTNSIFAVGYNFDGKDAYYPAAECQSTIGCDMPGSVQLVDNRLVFGNTRRGIMMLISTSGALENNVKPLSANVNAQLLKERGLEDACSADFDRYYWLCVNGYVYLWDYDTTPYYNYADYDVAQKRLAWYKFNNINASEFVSDTALYYERGVNVIKFLTERNDFGAAINGYFKTKAFDLGKPQVYKMFKNVYPSFSSDGDVMANVLVGDEKKENVIEKEFNFKTFDWDRFNWGTFGWGAVKFAETFFVKTNMQSEFIQITIKSDEKDRGLGLTGIRVDYVETKPTRRVR